MWARAHFLIRSLCRGEVGREREGVGEGRREGVGKGGRDRDGEEGESDV